ncbi:Stress response protein nst1 [Bienertia sinuspersici]
MTLGEFWGFRGFPCCCCHFPLLCKGIRMNGIWLLCDYGGRKFDGRIKDIDEINFLDFDDAMKQDVFLPRLWRMFYEYPSLLKSGRRVEVIDVLSLVRMFSEFVYEDEVKVFIEEAASVEVSFRLAMEKREARLRAEALKQKELQKAMEEERKRVEQERKRGRRLRKKRNRKRNRGVDYIEVL